MSGAASRCLALIAGSIIAASVALVVLAAASPLTLVATSDAIRVRAPDLRVLEGRVLSRLRDGSSARLTLRLEVSARRDAIALVQTEQTFVVSFDLWEEKFAVSRVGRPPRRVSHLTSIAAEAWCVDNVTVPMSAFGGDRPATLWAHLFVNTRTEPAVREEPDDGVSLRRLIDAFSRRGTEDEPTRVLEGGPFPLPN